MGGNFSNEYALIYTMISINDVLYILLFPKAIEIAIAYIAMFFH